MTQRVKQSWDDMDVIDLEIKKDESGSLVIFDVDSISGFNVVRMFNVFSDQDKVRGRHAHKKCQQLLVCNAGKILVKTFDGNINSEFLLDRPNLALLVPAKIWSEQVYLVDGSILTVLCDRPYEPEDYVRDFSEYLELRKIWDFSQLSESN
jgi:dTDP-4-dehydrorhamnose 3,5-epimerase-like enzyme